MSRVDQKLKEIDWEFSDYRGLFNGYADINSLHWYPAPFVPQIPAILIELLSKASDMVLDPFAGGGVALLEAAKLNRRFVGVDRNPHAIDIINAKFSALDVVTEYWPAKLLKDLDRHARKIESAKYVRNQGIHEDVLRWYHPSTLSQLCRLHAVTVDQRDLKKRLVLKTLLSSILLRACARREHYTYITDNCFPNLSEADPVDALKLFTQQAQLAFESVSLFRIQYEMMHGHKWHPTPNDVLMADARHLDFLPNESIDMVITSPPYLGVNDYVRSMRLTTLFFPDADVEPAIADEIGARRKRSRKRALEEYISDMNRVFDEMARVLKPSGFLAMVIGQGQGKVTKDTDVIGALLEILRKRHRFVVVHRDRRKIKFRRIQVPGVGSEEVIVCKRK